VPDVIQRQLETAWSLQVTGQGAGAVATTVADAGPVPYSLPVPNGVTAPLVYLPTGTTISSADVAGKIVVRDAATGSIPIPVFGAVAYYVHDPDLTFSPTGNYERDWIGAGTRIADLDQAEAGNAAGLLFVHGLPRDQVQGQYAPYPGVQWTVPALYLGVDEGTALKNRLATGEQLTATLTTAATVEPAPTRSVVARLPGRSPERIVIQSHTDGMNAVWDNGPVAILAMARYFAALPMRCRPRTFEFVFTTAHLHLSHSGAERYAAQLDHEYDSGTVALVVALEHLGAREFQAVPRGGGLPGRTLAPTGRSELFATFTIESPVLVSNLIGQVVGHDLRRTFVLRGADAPQLGFPPHRSYGGEGGPYRQHLVPTVAAITGPWTLFNPAFGMDELIDFNLMHEQALAFADLVLAVDDVPRQVIAGADTAYREGRSVTTGSNADWTKFGIN
jgi:hypothetical protein